MKFPLRSCSVWESLHGAPWKREKPCCFSRHSTRSWDMRVTWACLREGMAASDGRFWPATEFNQICGPERKKIGITLQDSQWSIQHKQLIRLSSIIGENFSYNSRYTWHIEQNLGAHFPCFSKMILTFCTLTKINWAANVFFLFTTFLKRYQVDSTLYCMLHHTHLSGEMLQSITVLLLVFIIRKGNCIVEFKAGRLRFCSSCWFLCTKFLNAICCRKKLKWSDLNTASLSGYHLRMWQS